MKMSKPPVPCLESWEWKTMDPTLKRMKEALIRLDNPQRAYRQQIVAGEERAGRRGQIQQLECKLNAVLYVRFAGSHQARLQHQLVIRQRFGIALVAFPSGCV